MMRKQFKGFKYWLLVLLTIIVFVACEESNPITDDTDLLPKINNFEFVQYDSNYTGSEAFVVLHGDIFNLTDSTYDITVTRVTHSIPATWSTSYCVGPACLPPFLDTFTFSLEAGDTALFSLDTYHNGESGMGSWTIFVVDSSTMEIDSVNINMEVIIDP